MSDWLSREHRKWVYGICLAVVPLLVAYGVIEQDAAPLWIALVGAVVAPSLALRNLSPEDSPEEAPGFEDSE